MSSDFDLPVAGRGTGLGPQFGFNDIECQHGPACCRGAKCRMVVEAKISFEPNNLGGAHQSVLATTTAALEPHRTVLSQSVRARDGVPRRRAAASCI